MRAPDDAQPPIVAIPLLRGGSCEVRPGQLSANGKSYALADIGGARLVSDATILVPPGAPPWPAVELRLRDERLITLTPADPPDAWRLMEGLFQAAPSLRIPLPPVPGRAQWRGGFSSVPGASFPRGPYGADSVEPGSTEAVLAGLSHLSIFFAPIILPLIVWLTSRERSPYAARQAKQALIFHAAYIVAGIIGAIAWLILIIGGGIASEQTPGTPGFPIALVVGFFIIFGLVLLLAVFEVIYSVYGAIRSFQGRPFSYPFLSRL